MATGAWPCGWPPRRACSRRSSRRRPSTTSAPRTWATAAGSASAWTATSPGTRSPARSRMPTSPWRPGAWSRRPAWHATETARSRPGTTLTLLRSMPGAIVIGAGPGIGTSVARRFAREGLAVTVLARSRPTVDRALAALAQAPGESLGLTVDVTDEARLRAALDEAVDRFGTPEVVVYNAALIQSDVPGELTAGQ